ncbi:hypothetical protein H0H93_005540 [Arthromyces matolae]|nr:hypothetical protein H0H93_005540 [Arthromyces matolae]
MNASVPYSSIFFHEFNIKGGRMEKIYFQPPDATQAADAFIDFKRENAEAEKIKATLVPPQTEDDAETERHMERQKDTEPEGDSDDDVEQNRRFFIEKLAPVYATCIAVMAFEASPIRKNKCGQILLHWRVEAFWDYALHRDSSWVKTPTIIFDTILSAGTSKVDVDVRYRTSFMSSQSQGGFMNCWGVENPTKIGDILDVICKEGLQFYSYDGKGSGCETWCRLVVAALVRADILPERAINDMERIRENAVGAEIYWLPKDKGQVLTEDEWNSLSTINE